MKSKKYYSGLIDRKTNLHVNEIWKEFKTQLNKVIDGRARLIMSREGGFEEKVPLTLDCARLSQSLYLYVEREACRRLRRLK